MQVGNSYGLGTWLEYYKKGLVKVDKEDISGRLEKNFNFAQLHQRRQHESNFEIPHIKYLNTFNVSSNPWTGQRGTSREKTNELMLLEMGWKDRRSSSSTTCGIYEVARGSRLGQRHQMEDEDGVEEITFTVEGKTIKAPLFFVLDGHHGEGAAQFVKIHLAAELIMALESCNKDGLSDAGIYKALKTFSVSLDKAFLESICLKKGLKSSERDRSGTTLTLVVELDGYLYCANIGDSRAVLCLKQDGEKSSYHAIQLSEDAVTDITRYAKKIKDEGGKIIDGRINGYLAPARAFGNFVHFEDRASEKLRGLSVVSKITRFSLKEIKKGSFLVIATDGLWDKLASEHLETLFLKMKDDSLETMVKKLVLGAAEMESKDNVSVVLVKF